MMRLLGPAWAQIYALLEQGSVLMLSSWAPKLIAITMPCCQGRPCSPARKPGALVRKGIHSHVSDHAGWCLIAAPAPAKELADMATQMEQNSNSETEAKASRAPQITSHPPQLLPPGSRVGRKGFHMPVHHIPAQGQGEVILCNPAAEGPIRFMHGLDPSQPSHSTEPPWKFMAQLQGGLGVRALSSVPEQGRAGDALKGQHGWGEVLSLGVGLQIQAQVTIW